MSLEKLKLDNGLTIYNDHIAGARTNDVRMFVPYGSVDEQPGNEGLAHVFEHCVHLKTDMFNDRVALKQFADTNGMYTNASTNFARTDYYANGLDLEPSMIHLSQILQHTHFPEEAVAHELKAVRREMKTRLDSVGEVHSLGAINAMYGLPYGRSIGGYSDKIDFDVDTLRQLHERYYKLGHMALMVSGKARTSDVAEMAMRYFTPDTGAVVEPHISPLPIMGVHHRTGLVRETSANAMVSVTYPLSAEFVQRNNENSLTYGIARRVMGQAAFQMLRYQRGLSYNGGIAFDEIHPNAVVLSGDVTTDGENVDAAIATFNEVYARDNTSYTDEEIMGSMMAYKYALNAGYTSSSARVGRIEAALEMHREPRDMALVLRRLGKVGVADVRAALDAHAEYMATNKPYVHVTGNRAAVGEVERMIDQSEVA